MHGAGVGRGLGDRSGRGDAGIEEQIAFNRTCVESFVANRPTRAVLRADFTFDWRIEMKAIAFMPRATGRGA